MPDLDARVFSRSRQSAPVPELVVEARPSGVPVNGCSPCTASQTTWYGMVRPQVLAKSGRAWLACNGWFSYTLSPFFRRGIMRERLRPASVTQVQLQEQMPGQAEQLGARSMPVALSTLPRMPPRRCCTRRGRSPPPAAP